MPLISRRDSNCRQKVSAIQLAKRKVTLTSVRCRSVRIGAASKGEIDCQRVQNPTLKFLLCEALFLNTGMLKMILVLVARILLSDLQMSGVLVNAVDYFPFISANSSSYSVAYPPHHCTKCRSIFTAKTRALSVLPLFQDPHYFHMSHGSVGIVQKSTSR